MKTFLVQVGVMALATVVAGALCALACYALGGPSGVMAAVAAALATLPAGLAAAAVVSRYGADPVGILLSAGLRVGLTLGVGVLVALAVRPLWGPEFFLSLGVVYLSHLATETWFVYEQSVQRAHGRSGLCRAESPRSNLC